MDNGFCVSLYLAGEYGGDDGYGYSPKEFGVQNIDQSSEHDLLLLLQGFPGIPVIPICERGEFATHRKGDFA